jgi:hypothetical protein
MDFFLRGQLKQLVYSIEIKHVKLDQITNNFNEIRQDDATIAHVYQSIVAFELKDILNNFYQAIVFPSLSFIFLVIHFLKLYFNNLFQ